MHPAAAAAEVRTAEMALDSETPWLMASEKS